MSMPKMSKRKKKEKKRKTDDVNVAKALLAARGNVQVFLLALFFFFLRPQTQMLHLKVIVVICGKASV